MTRVIFSICAVLCAISTTNAQKKNGGEQDAVRKVIEQETQYYFDGNYAKWANTWAHEPTSYLTRTGPTGHFEFIGWEKIDEAIKPDLRNVPLIASEEYKDYAKYDYNFKINGNLAVVTFKEGKGDFQTKVLEKKNGEWKVIGLTIVAASNYKVRSDYNSLKSWIGKWKCDPGSYRTEPADSLSSIKSYTLEVSEGPYGIDLISNGSYTYNGRTIVDPPTREQFVPDFRNNAIKYFDFQRPMEGYITSYGGNVSFDTSGNAVIKVMYEDKPGAVQFDNTYIPNKDGSMKMAGRMFDKAGKVTYSWSYNLERL